MVATNRRVLLMILVASGLFAFQRVASAQVTIPAGIKLEVGLNDRLDTGEAREGDRFTGYSDSGVRVDNGVCR